MSKYPYTRLANAVIKVAPEESKSDFKIALESVLPGEGRLSDNPVVESDTPGNKFEPGDILFGKLRPYLAKVWVADRPGSFIGDFLRFTPKPGWDSRFLGYVLRSPEFIDRASAEAYGSKMPRIEWERIKNYQIPAPLLVEQKRIADKLDRELAEIDELIADVVKLQKLIEEREIAELEKNLIENATEFVELRRLKPKCISGTSVNAAPWQAGDSEFGVLKTGVVSKGYFDPSQNKAVIEESEISRLSVPVKANTIIVNRANSPELVGSAAFVEKGYPNLFLSDKLWQIDFEDANNEYMAVVMQTRFFKEQIRQRCVGASSSMQNLSYQDFLTIKVPKIKYRKIKIAYEKHTELKLLINSLEEKKISTIAEKMKGKNSEPR